MAAAVPAEEIPRFIDTQIKPHLNKILRVLGNERPAAPIEFIAECFVNNNVPERSAPRAWDESLMSYLLSHDVVARVERAIATCAIRHASVDNPLEFVGNLLLEAIPPRITHTRTRPAALDVPGRGAGSAPQYASPRSPGPPPASPKSPGTALQTPVSMRQSKMGALSLDSPASARGLDSARSTSYDTMSRGSHHRLYQVVRPAVVRAGVEPNSLRTERLRIGERLTILESREFGGVTRVRFSRGWTSMWTKDNIPILVPADESDAQAVAEYRIRYTDGKPAVLMADLDPWSEPQAEIASGLVPLVQIRVSDGGETFVETSSGWHCVSGWENMKSLVPDWKPTSPSPLSSAASGSPSAGEGGDPAFGGSGEDNGSSAGSTPTKVMRKATPWKGARKDRDGANALLARAGHSDSYNDLREAAKETTPAGLFGANSSWKRNMSFFSQQQAQKAGKPSAKASMMPQMVEGDVVSHTEAADDMQRALQEVDGS